MKSQFDSETDDVDEYLELLWLAGHLRGKAAREWHRSKIHNKRTISGTNTPWKEQRLVLKHIDTVSMQLLKPQHCLFQSTLRTFFRGKIASAEVLFGLGIRLIAISALSRQHG